MGPKIVDQQSTWKRRIIREELTTYRDDEETNTKILQILNLWMIDD